MAGKDKGSLTPKVVVPLDELQQALNPANPTGFTAQLEDVDGGAVGAARQAEYDRIQSAPLEAAQAEANDSLADKVSAAAQESYTGYIAEALERSYSTQYGAFDPSFDGSRNALELLQRMGLEQSDENIQLLARAGTAQDQLDLANGLKRHANNQDILMRHGGFALASGVLDPVTLMADFATFGAAKSLKLSRIAAGTLGAGVGTGLTGAADAAGKDTTGFDYLLNAAITGGAMAAFGGAAATKMANGGGHWFGAPSIPAATGARRVVNNFLSESDKLMATPEAADVIRNLIDDPVRRAGVLSNGNAASIQRRYSNELDGLMKEYDDAVEEALAQTQGWSWLGRKVDTSGRYSEAKDALNARVAEELLRRDNDWFRYGNVYTTNRADPIVQRLADLSDKLHGRAGEIARDAGVRGFEDFQPRPGYFHRSWNDSLFRKMEANQPGMPRALLTEAAFRGIQGISRDEADAIAGALMQRVKDKASGIRSEFLGALGKADTAFVRESLERAKVEQGRIDSIMKRIEQKASDQGTIKYGKHRLTLDMGVQIKANDGSIYKMTDLIDTDLDRVMENYVSSIAGRSALAKAGIGGDDAAIEAFKRNYLKSIATLPQQEQDGLMLQLDGILGDFTGNRPTENILGPVTQRVKSLADATMLSASGLWQVGEYATMAARHGFFETGKEFMRRFPGIRNILDNAKGNPDLADELQTVLGLDLARDVRLRPWKRQHDAFLQSSDTVIDRLLHAGKQAVPYLNAMKYVHNHQARMNANLVLNKFARAAKGDTAALEVIKKYAPDINWANVKGAIDRNVTYGVGKNATSFNWGGWGKGEIDEVMNAALRMMDDSLLYGRIGQGASFSRSQVGQVLGQFRSFVSFAHNKLLRGTLNADGAGGLAMLLAFQYPLTFLMVNVNEARKGELDLSEKGLKNTAKKAIGYTAGLGFAADAAGVVGLTGGRGGLSVPLVSAAEAPARVVGGLTDIAQGEYRSGAADIGKAATMVVPFLNVMPGTALALDALKGE